MLSPFRRLLARLAGILRRRPPRACRIFVQVATQQWSGGWHAQWWVAGSDGVMRSGKVQASTPGAARLLASLKAEGAAYRHGYPVPERIEIGAPRWEVGHG